MDITLHEVSNLMVEELFDSGYVKEHNAWSISLMYELWLAKTRRCRLCMHPAYRNDALAYIEEVMQACIKLHQMRKLL